jgi:hypothetical protein
MGDWGRSPDSGKRTIECSSRLFALFELRWERELEGQSWRLGQRQARCIVGRREVLRRRLAATDGTQRRRTLADSWGRRSTGASSERREIVVGVENGFEGGTGYGMGIKSLHWVTFKQRIRCTIFG